MDNAEEIFNRIKSGEMTLEEFTILTYTYRKECYDDGFDAGYDAANEY